MSTHYFLRLVCSSFPENSHSSNALAHVSWTGGQHSVSVRLSPHPLGLECSCAYVSYILASFLHSHVSSVQRMHHHHFRLTTYIVTFAPHISSSVSAFRNIVLPQVITVLILSQ